MTSIVAKARSNFFRVKPTMRAGFFDLMRSADVKVEEKGDGTLALFSNTEDGDWPIIKQDIDESGSVLDLDDHADGFSITTMIQSCIEPGDVAILVEVSEEGFRSVGGWGAAITSEGVEEVDLVSVLVDKAKALSGKDKVSSPSRAGDLL